MAEDDFQITPDKFSRLTAAVNKLVEELNAQGKAELLFYVKWSVELLAQASTADEKYKKHFFIGLAVGAIYAAAHRSDGEIDSALAIVEEILPSVF
jgi:hypothetical protein